MYSIILHMNALVIIVTMNHKLFALPPSISYLMYGDLREPIIIVNATSSFIVDDVI